MTTDHEHGAFEKWAAGEGYIITKGADGDYLFPATWLLLKGWRARASLSTPEGGGVPEGWKLVPIDPAAKQLLAGWNVHPGEDRRARQAYAAVLAAAPAPPVSAPSVGVKVKPDAMRYKVPAAGAFDTSGGGWTWMYGPWLPSGYRDGAEPLYLHPAPTAPKGVDAVEVMREWTSGQCRDPAIAADILAGNWDQGPLGQGTLSIVRFTLKAAGIPDTSEGGE